MGRSCATPRDALRLKGHAAMAHDLLHEQWVAKSVRGEHCACAGWGVAASVLKHAGTEAGKQGPGCRKVIH